MLVITRKPGEKICLGDDVTVTVLDVVGSAVRLGIEAPAEIPVYRYEIWAAVQEEKAMANAPTANVVGTWTGYAGQGASGVPVDLTLAQTGTNVTGNLTVAARPAVSRTVPIWLMPGSPMRLR